VDAGDFRVDLAAKRVVRADGTETHHLRAYLAQLRRTLEPSRPRHLVTEAGMGYRFEV
jgi:DNA-binding response OmpR family regulator